MTFTLPEIVVSRSRQGLWGKNSGRAALTAL